MSRSHLVGGGAGMRLEVLEGRDVPAVFGAVDPSFGTGGVASQSGVQFSGVAAQPDGKVVVVGHQGGDAQPGNSDFLVVRYNVDGTPDTTFGSNGQRTVDFALGGDNSDLANSVAIQPDGKIVVVGSAATAANGTDFAITRLNPDGSLDTGFGTGGKVNFDFGGGVNKNDTANAVALAANGDIFVIGSAATATGAAQFGAARLSGANGALVAGFGAGGKEVVNIGGNGSFALSVALQADGKIVIGGDTLSGSAKFPNLDFAIARLDPTTGAPDATFNGTGTVTFNFGGTSHDTGGAVAIQQDGKIIIAGSTSINAPTANDAGVLRLNPDGTIDTTFNGNGWTFVNFGGGNDGVVQVLLQADGRIVLVGNSDTGTAVARLLPTGALDSSLNGTGIAHANVTAPRGATQAPDGRILGATTFFPSVGEVAEAFRLNGPIALELGSTLLVSGNSGAQAQAFTFNITTGQYATPAAATIAPFVGFGVDVRTATGDVNGDNIPDTVLVTGPGAPVKFAVVSGADNTTVLIPPTSPFAGSEDFTGGGFVAAADLDGDGRAEIILSPDLGGGSRVTIFSLPAGATTPTLRANLLGIDDPNFRGGARVATGDVNGDGVPDLAVAAGFLGGPRTALFNGTTLFSTPTRLVGDFFAFPGTDATTLRNGVFVALGDMNGDGFADLIFGGGPGGAPRVFILSGQLVAANNVAGAQASPIANFFVAGNTNDRGGVRVAAVDADRDLKADVAVGSGEGSPARVRVYLGKNFSGSSEPATFQDLSVFGGGTLPGGVFVG